MSRKIFVMRRNVVAPADVADRPHIAALLNKIVIVIFLGPIASEVGELF